MSDEKQVPETAFNLAAFRKERDEKRDEKHAENLWQWKPTAEDIIAAYQAGERDLTGANLTGENLRGTNLSSVYLTGADLTGANLMGANLIGVDFGGANLDSANFSGANLDTANFSGAYLSGANLSDANLSGANFSGAFLNRTLGIKVVYCVGDKKRLVFAYLYNAEIHIQVRCRNGTPAEIRSAVKKDYLEASDGYQDYMDTILYLERWGERMLKQAKSKEN